MILKLENNTAMVLNSLYEKLVQNLVLSRKKLIKKSVLLTLMKLSSNDTFKIVSNSSRSFEASFNRELNSLEKMGLISHPDDKDKMDEVVISVKGIWYVENSVGVLELDDILTYIQNTKFEFSKARQELNDTEKVILYSLLAVRVFSQNIPMDLNTPELCSKWKEIIEDITIPFLQTKNLIMLKSVIDKKTGIEDPISYLMRHANDLPKKTNNLFVPTKRNQYYLALNTDNRNKCVSQMMYLFKKMVPDMCAMDLTDDIYGFLCTVAHNQSLYVTTSFEFITSTWDQIIKECLDQIYLGLDISY
jgi:hypothetical protein